MLRRTLTDFRPHSLDRPWDVRGAPLDKNRRAPSQIPLPAALLHSSLIPKSPPSELESPVSPSRPSVAAAESPHPPRVSLPIRPPSSPPLPSQPLWPIHRADVPKRLCSNRSPFPRAADPGFQTRSD